MTPQEYARVKELFARLIDLDPDERNAILDAECGNDAAIREEVESLLKHDDPRTIIQSGDATVAEFSPVEVAVPRRIKIPPTLRRLGRLTDDLGPRGLLALGGLLCCVLLSLIGYVGQLSLRRFQKELRRITLDEIVDAKVLALQMWVKQETQKVESWARSDRLRESINELATLTNQSDEISMGSIDAPVHEKIRAEVTALAGNPEHYTIWDRRYRLVADSLTAGGRIGESATPWGSSILANVFAGQSELFPLDKHRSITKLGDDVKVLPHLAIVSPVRNSEGQIIAALQIHSAAAREDFSSFLHRSRLGKSGETFVFDKDGLILTVSRHEQQFREWGLIPKETDSGSRPRIYLRDPGADLTAGYQIEDPLESLPLTEMARQCLAGNNGSDAEGYRDFRGVLVVGAWRWLDELQVGVATEIDVDEAAPAIRVLRIEAFVIFALFAFCFCVLVGSFYSIAKLRENFGEQKVLGPYRLERQIGEGGMGKVFKAQHELLKRPTAIKLLKPAFLDQDSIARFQREARLVSRLEHFNTIGIYDYGVSDEGLFYLVMEYIDGLNLTELVDLEKSLPPQRVIFLMRQILGSLHEAHSAGLVHRDLKPGNVMICQRAGTSDVVKVLDFGLVKPIETSQSQMITGTNLIAGTPEYMAPERVSSAAINDPRSDLYAVGAIAFFCLTGNHAVGGKTLAEVLFCLVNQPPPRPSDHTQSPIPPELDELVYRCLAKDPNERPQSAGEIIEELDSWSELQCWSENQAQTWWKTFNRLRKTETRI